MDGRELVDFLMSVMLGTSELSFKGSDRIYAVSLLLDRGWGKVQSVVDGDPKMKPILDLDKMTPQELEFLENVRLGLSAIGERLRGSEAKAEPQ